MGSADLAILTNALAPVLGALICLGAPVVIVFLVKHFKLRHRELELEAQFSSREWQLRLQSVEARLGAIETALGALGPARGTAQERAALLEPPPVPVQKVRGG
jgi:hypothetical protein